jgi:hypothetical protein
VRKVLSAASEESAESFAGDTVNWLRHIIAAKFMIRPSLTAAERTVISAQVTGESDCLRFGMNKLEATLGALHVRV